MSLFFFGGLISRGIILFFFRLNSSFLFNCRCNLCRLPQNPCHHNFKIKESSWCYFDFSAFCLNFEMKVLAALFVSVLMRAYRFLRWIDTLSSFSPFRQRETSNLSCVTSFNISVQINSSEKMCTFRVPWKGIQKHFR